LSSEKNLSFSSEVAETLGVECAIILNQYNENLLEDITSLDSLIKSTKKNISFLDEEKIKESINTLIKYKLIDIIKIRTNLVNEVVKLKEYKNEIVDKKRISLILKKIKKKSISKKIDPKITNRIWKNMIWSYIDYERRVFKKK